jgi:hypothetical protein
MRTWLDGYVWTTMGALWMVREGMDVHGWAVVVPPSSSTTTSVRRAVIANTDTTLATTHGTCA